MDKKDFKTKCPLCMIGFTIVCTSQTEFIHLDIVWSNEAGIQQDCQDPKQVLPYIVPNSKHGTGFSLSEEFKEMYDQLEVDFLATPERFSKENIPDIGDFFLITQAFVKYGDYCDERTIKDDATEIATVMYNDGKNLKEIMEAVTEPELKINNNG